MKKKSIFIMVLAALVALSVFTGCEQASVNLPKYVVSASVTSEDFLAGQAFDPNKITVTVNYSDGSSSTLTGVELDATTKDEKVTVGSSVTVNAGLNIKGEVYSKTIDLPVYVATGLKVTAPASVTVTGKTSSEDVDAALFTVSATYQNGEIALLPNVDYTVTVDASKLVANQAANVTAKISAVEIFSEGTTTEVSATYTEAPVVEPTYDYESFTWEQNQLAFSVADVNAFERSAFDADNITLYRIYKNGQVGNGYYLIPVDNSDVTYGFADGVATEAEQYPAYVASTSETAQIYFDYKYVAEGETTGILSHIDEEKILFEVDPADFTADAEGRLIPNKVTGSYDTTSKEIIINLRPDYVTAVDVKVTEDKKALYVGETVQSLWLDVTATYASGYTAEGGNKLGNDDFEVTPNVALKLGDKISVKVTDTYGKNAALYGKSATFDTDLQVFDYIISFKAALKSSVKTPILTGQVLTPNDFEFTDFVLASAPDKTTTAPAGVEYTMWNSMIPTGQIAGGYGNFWINASLNGKPVATDPSQMVQVTVPAAADYPTSIVIAERPKEVLINAAINKDLFKFNITWASGNTYPATVDIDAPEITFEFDPTSAPGEANPSLSVTVTWKCGEAADSMDTTLNVVSELSE